MIVQSRTVIDGDEKTDMTFTCVQADLPRALALMKEKHGDIEYKELEADEDVAKVSIVGVGMRTNSGVAKTMFGALAEKNINIKVITTSEIKTSVLVGADYLVTCGAHASRCLWARGQIPRPTETRPQKKGASSALFRLWIVDPADQLSR